MHKKKFNVEITETLRKSVVVEAYDEQEAKESVRQKWRRSWLSSHGDSPLTETIFTERKILL